MSSEKNIIFEIEPKEGFPLGRHKNTETNQYINLKYTSKLETKTILQADTGKEETTEEEEKTESNYRWNNM